MMETLGERNRHVQLLNANRMSDLPFQSRELAEREIVGATFTRREIGAVKRHAGLDIGESGNGMRETSPPWRNQKAREIVRFCY
jgi:hypothetical protein